MRTRRHQYHESEESIIQKPNHRDPVVKPATAQQILANQAPTVINQNLNKTEENLRKLYDDIKATPSLSAKINDFLRKHELHSKFRRIVKTNFPRRQIIARFPYEVFMADLIEYPKFKVINKGYVYILLLIDCFTKQIFILVLHHGSCIQ